MLVLIFLLNVPADHKYAESLHCFCSSFTFLQVHLTYSIVCRDNAVLMAWSGLGTLDDSQEKTTFWTICLCEPQTTLVQRIQTVVCKAPDQPLHLLIVKSALVSLTWIRYYKYCWNIDMICVSIPVFYGLVFCFILKLSQSRYPSQCFYILCHNLPAPHPVISVHM